MKTVFYFFLHLVRLLLSKTTQRKVEHERDEIGEEGPPQSQLADGTGPVVLPLPAPEATPSPVQPPIPMLVVASAPISVEAEEPFAPTAPPRLPILSVGADGWLIGEKVVRVPTERCYTWRSKSGKPLGALWHWTATSHGTALGMAKRTVKRPGSSVHLWIEHDGTIYQSAPMARSTGHAGGKSARGVREEDGTIVFDPKASLDVNGFLLGSEIVCVGEVRRMMKLADGSYGKATSAAPSSVYMGWPFGRWRPKLDGNDKPILDKNGKQVMYVDKGPIVKAEQVKEAVDEAGIHRCYQDYTPAQVDAVERLCRAWRDKYGWTDAQMSWGHIDSDPSRKSDPGPLLRKKWLPEIFERMRREP